MKKISKLFALALLTSLFSFASCSNGSSDSDGNPDGSYNDLIHNDAIAVFIGEDIGNGITYCINCFSDNSFIERVYDGNITFTESKGAYELVNDSTFDSGLAYIIITHTADQSLELKPLAEALKAPVQISNGKFTLYGIRFTKITDFVVFHGKINEETSVAFKFYEDKTFEQIAFENSESLKISKGTYNFKNGDYLNGTIVLTCKQFINNETKKLENITNPEEYPDQTLDITNGKFSIDFEGNYETSTVTFSKQ